MKFWSRSNRSNVTPTANSMGISWISIRPTFSGPSTAISLLLHLFLQDEMFQFPLKKTQKAKKWEPSQTASSEISLPFSNRPAIFPIIKNRSNIWYIEWHKEQIKHCYCQPTMDNIWMKDSHLMLGLNSWPHYDFGKSPGEQHDWSFGCSDVNLSQLLLVTPKSVGFHWQRENVHYWQVWMALSLSRICFNAYYYTI